jgi:LysM repeat protein
LAIISFGLIFSGCVRDEDFWALQADVTQLENRIDKVEDKTLEQTQTILTDIEQSQRNQGGAIDQTLTRMSQIERGINNLARQQENIQERLDRLERSQLKDRESIAAISTKVQSDMTTSLNDIRKDFNQAQKQLAGSVSQKMETYSQSVDSRIRKLEKELDSFLSELDTTIESYSSGKYIVKSGDTLSKIASELGVSVEDLARINKIDDPGKIRVGQELLIP